MRISASSLVGFAGSTMIAAMFVMSGCGGDDDRPTINGSGQGGSSAGVGGTSSTGAGGDTTATTTASGGSTATSTSAAAFECKKGAVNEAQLAPGKNGTWGSAGGIVGGSFTYAKTDAEKFTVDVATTKGESKLTGTILVNSYAGSGLYFKDPEKCFDIGSSQWTTGIRLTIGGTLGEAKLAFQLQQNNDYPISATDGKGACTGTWGSGCSNNSTTLTIAETPAPIEIKYSDLTGGAPEAVNLADVIGFQLHVDCPQNAAADCPVTLTVGKVELF